jgi:hypothetical protein
MMALVARILSIFGPFFSWLVGKWIKKYEDKIRAEASKQLAIDAAQKESAKMAAESAAQVKEIEKVMSDTLEYDKAQLAKLGETKDS